MDTHLKSVEEYGIHEGFWINWSYGRYQGATITLTTRKSALLIAFLAIFTASISKGLWRMICFTSYHILSSKRQQDGIYHQRQAILRNSSTAVDALRGFAQILLAWRQTGDRPYLRLAPLLIVAAICSLAFATASIFSSNIATSRGSEVLVSSPNCGIYPSNDDVDFTTRLKLVYPSQSQDTALAYNYALQCYTNSTASERCKLYVKKQLTINVKRDAECPYNSTMCKTPKSNLILDTGYINSHTDLGLNAPQNSRFLYRAVHHCAPIVTDGYSEMYDGTNSSLQAQAMRYYYGKPWVRQWNNDSFTYQYPIRERIQNSSGLTTTKTDYSVGYLTSYWNDTRGMYFTPIPELLRDNSDLSLFFLSSDSVSFVAPTNDPWYAAHTLGNVTIKYGTQNATAENVATYVSDDPVRVLACSRQVQWCNPNLPEATRCTPLGAAAGSRATVARLWEGEREQLLISNAFVVMRTQMQMESVLKYLGVSALLARYKMTEVVQGPLPDNQWQLEVEHWHATQLASMQAAFVNMATGPRDPALIPLMQKADGETTNYLCRNQKVFSTAYTSFSLFGLGTILVAGTLIAIIDLTMEPLFEWLKKRTQKDVYGILEWKTNSTLQMQRLAHEQLGFGTWTKTSEAAPVTERGELLSTIHAEDPAHPVLMTLSDMGIEKEDFSS